MAKQKTSTTTVTLDSIAPNPANPRTITGERAQKLAEYLDEFGDLSGVVHNTRKGFDVLISGHQRMEVFRGGGGDLVITEDFSPAQPDGTIARGYIEMDGKRYQYRRVDWPKEKADRATLVANGTFGEWDADKLSEWGYEPEQLEEMGVWLADDSEEGEGGVPNNALNSEKVEEDDFEAHEIETVQTDIVLGDLFEIGAHRLLCGDSTKVEDVERVMGGAFADLIVTDPPYGVAYVGGTKDKLTIQNDALTPEQTFALWEAALTAGLLNTKDGGGIYATVPPGRLQLGFMRVMDDTECLRQVMVWNKNQMVLGHSDYHYKHEPILYGWKPGASHYFTSDRTQTTVFDFEKPQRNGDHPTMKPVGLWAKMISNSSKEGWLTYDPFLGSGTTMVAAHQLNRKCYGLELEPKYCDVIVRRMLKLDNTLTVKRNGVDETDKWLIV